MGGGEVVDTILLMPRVRVRQGYRIEHCASRWLCCTVYLIFTNFEGVKKR